LHLTHSEVFRQLDIDDDTEHFLAYSSKKSLSSFRYKYRLPKLLSRLPHDYDQLHRLKMADSFLLSPGQFRQLLSESGFNVNRPNLEIFAFGQGSGSVLVNLGRGLDTNQLFARDKNAAANRAAKEKGIKVENGEFYANLEDSTVRQAECQNARKYDVILLCNVVDRTALPSTLIRNALEHLKPGGVVVLSVSLPWRPAFTDKICHPLMVRGQSEKAKHIFGYYDHKIHDELIPPLPQNAAHVKKTYPWHSPPAIPPTFEEAFIQVFNGLRSGGKKQFYPIANFISFERVQYVNELLHQEKGRPVEVAGWTRNPYWLVGTPMTMGMDQATFVLKKEDASRMLIGFDDDDDDDEDF